MFLDYNQNAKDRTVASAYSVRPTPDARVSFPLRWDEVPDVVMEDYTLATVPAIFAERGDAGAGIDEAVGSLEALLELSARHEAEGEGDAPWPPNYAKQEGEPPRVQPSRKRQGRQRVRGPGQGRRAAARGRRGTRRRRRGGRSQRRACRPSGRAPSRRPPAAARARSRWWRSGGRRRRPRSTRASSAGRPVTPRPPAYLEPADVIETAMRGRAYAWYRLRVRLTNVPEAIRPAQEELDPDAAPDDWGSLSDDERAAWLGGPQAEPEGPAGRRVDPTRARLRPAGRRGTVRTRPRADRRAPCRLAAPAPGRRGPGGGAGARGPRPGGVLGRGRGGPRAGLAAAAGRPCWTPARASSTRGGGAAARSTMRRPCCATWSGAGRGATRRP